MYFGQQASEIGNYLLQQAMWNGDFSDFCGTWQHQLFILFNPNNTSTGHFTGSTQIEGTIITY